MVMTRNDVPQFPQTCSGMVRELDVGTYDPETQTGTGAVELGGCRAINCSDDGTISYYDFTQTLVSDYAVVKGPNFIAVKALTAADVTVWGMF